MKKRLFLLVIFVIFILNACSGTKKKAVAPNDIPDDLVAVLPSGDELYIYMMRDSAEKLIYGQGTQDILGLVNYEDINLRVGYIDDKLVYMDWGNNSEIYLKSGISSDTKFNELDSNFETSSGEKVQHAIRRFKYEAGKKIIETKVNEGSGILPFEYINVVVDFYNNEFSKTSVFDVYAGRTVKFDK
ncbi:hypothetical protein H8S75_31310 [Hungatella sp. L12]|uniref:DUF5067 domain-containing protein n=1 Tax=Hungatella hominis TaxID=2763050 RepID=A0ABR7HGS4_9FIRM|nr:hypothetical protein [Hungatella hominis]MBC5712391.1 hypothetical protein [Hungatella hominis]